MVDLYAYASSTMLYPRHVCGGRTKLTWREGHPVGNQISLLPIRIATHPLLGYLTCA